MMRVSAIGSPTSVREALSTLLAETGADKFIATMPIYDNDSQLHFADLAADAFNSLAYAEVQPAL